VIARIIVIIHAVNYDKVNLPFQSIYQGFSSRKNKCFKDFNRHSGHLRAPDHGDINTCKPPGYVPDQKPDSGFGDRIANPFRHDNINLCSYTNDYFKYFAVLK